MRYRSFLFIATLLATALPAVAGLPVLEAAPIPWATPLDSGPLRVLAIAPRFAMWDIHALGERLEMELTPIPVWQSQALGFDPALPEEHTPGFAAEEIQAALADALSQPHDLYILANLDPAILPEAALSEIITRVAQGAGLLLGNMSWYGHGPLDIILQNVESPDPATRSEIAIGANMRDRAENLHLGIINAGRVAEFDYPESPPLRLGLLPETTDPVLNEPAFVDETLSLVARAALWAAGRDRPIRIANLTDRSPEGPNPDEIPPELPDEFIESLQDLPMQQPMRPFVVTLSEAAPKKMELKIQVRERGRTNPAYTLTEDVRKGQQEITTFLYLGTGRLTVDTWLLSRKGVVDWASREIEVDDWPEIQALRADKTWLQQNDRLQLNVSVRPVHSRYRDATVYARATDNFGRVVAETHAFVDADGGNRTLTFSFADLLAPLIVVEIYAIAGRQPSPSSFVLGVNESDRLYFPVRMSQDSDSLHLVATVPDIGGPASLDFLRILAESGVDTVYAPAGDATLFQSAAAGLRLLPELGAWHADRALDGTRRDPCLSDVEFQSREAARVSENALLHWAGGTGTYGLGNPSYFIATDEPACQAPACRARLRSAGRDVDPESPAFWQHRNDVFADFLGRMASATRQVDTQGQAGFRASGGNNLRHAYDWHALLKSLNWIVTDPEPNILHKIRSYAATPNHSGIVLGDRLRPDSESETVTMLWRTALNGFGQVWLDRPYGSINNPSSGALVTGNGMPSSRLDEIATTLTAINRTAGPLLANANAVLPVIGLVEDPVSAITSARGLADTDDYARTETAMVNLLNALGFPWQFIRLEDIGSAKSESLRALFLPRITKMNPTGHQALARFSRRGGMLFANTIPEGGAKLASSAWTSLAEATPDSPAILLGTPGIDGSYAYVLDDLAVRLLDAGLELRVPLDASNPSARHLERFHFRYGAADIIGVLADGGYRTERVSLHFGKEASVYNLIEETAVLRPHKNYIRLEPGSAALFAVLPYAVKNIELIAPEAVSAGGRLPLQCILGTDGGQSGNHLIAAELVPINGEAKPWHQKTFVCNNALGRTYFPLARNIPLGHYQLHVRDLLSGIEAHHDVKVVPPATFGGTEVTEND